MLPILRSPSLIEGFLRASPHSRTSTGALIPLTPHTSVLIPIAETRFRYAGEDEESVLLPSLHSEVTFTAIRNEAPSIAGILTT